MDWNILINDAPPVSRLGEFYFRSITAQNETSPVWREVVTRRDTGFPRFDQHLWFDAQTSHPQYDDDGNLTDDGRWTYSWDAENRLRMIETTVNALNVGHPYVNVSFRYDPEGRRLARNVFRWDDAQQTWVHESTRYLYDGWNVVAEFRAPHPDSFELTHTRSHTWGLDLSGTFQGAGGVGGLLRTTVHSGTPAHFHPSFDGNGNIVAWTQNNETGTVARREYDAFGNTLVAEGVAPCTFGFSTKMEEEQSGLYYYGYRWYDPVTGRWPSRDPIEEEGGINLYGFVGNDGVNQWDYLGQQCLTLDPNGNLVPCDPPKPDPPKPDSKKCCGGKPNPSRGRGASRMRCCGDKWYNTTGGNACCDNIKVYNTFRECCRRGKTATIIPFWRHVGIYSSQNDCFRKQFGSNIGWVGGGVTIDFLIRLAKEGKGTPQFTAGGLGIAYLQAAALCQQRICPLDLVKK